MNLSLRQSVLVAWWRERWGRKCVWICVLYVPGHGDLAVVDFSY